jgi:tetratricopeptide (TPR) repeat protein
MPPDWSRRLAAAMQLHQSGQFPDAIEHYRKLAAERPDHPDVLHLLGMALDQAGHPAQGKPAIEMAIRQSPGVAAYHASLGNACRALGDAVAAAAAYAVALELDSKLVDAHIGLGLLAQGRQDWSEARQHFQFVLTAYPGNTDAAFNLAVTDWSAGEHATALGAFRSLIKTAPSYLPLLAQLVRRAVADGAVTGAAELIAMLRDQGVSPADYHVLSGTLAAQQKDLATAEQHYRSALALAPDHRDALRFLSRHLLDQQDFKGALPLLERAHALMPGDFSVFSALGVALLRTGEHARALPVLRQVVAHNPMLAGAWGDLAATCAKLFLLEEAVDALRRLVELEPDVTAHYANLANYEAQIGNLERAEAAIAIAMARAPEAITTLGNLANIRDLGGASEEAEAIYRRILARDPDEATTHTNLALLLLRHGRLREGWQHFAWRSRARDWSSTDGSRGLPGWDGQLPPPGPLLTWREQGIGDEILYSAVLPELAARGLPIVQATDPRLVPLFARSFPGIQVVPDDQNLDAAALNLAAQRPLADMAALARPDAASFSSHPRAYLKAAPDRVATLREKYRARGRPLLVGVAWSSRNPRTGRSKSLQLADMQPLLGQADVTYVSLQYGDAADDVAALRAATGLDVLQDPTIDPLTDIDAQAAQIAALDLVVTVSTAAAHLAAGLGVPTLILLRQDWGRLWYWGDKGECTPWYPSVRLCRVSSGASAAALVTRGYGMMQEMLAPLRGRQTG